VKVVSIVGARPQFVKAAPVSRALRGRHAEVVVHTGQHYDDEMSASFFRDLQMDEPMVNLEVGRGTPTAQAAEMVARLEPILRDEAPDAVLVYGDTTSTLAGAVATATTRGPDGRRARLAHVEAGLRSFNREMAEERNRVVADHLADLLLAPTPTAAANLAREGLATRCELVGDVMVDAFRWAKSRAEGQLPPEAPSDGAPYVLLTLHRAETVDDPARLAGLLDGLPGHLPILFPIHPRTRAVLAGGDRELPDNVVALPPVGYLAMVALELGATLIATDSGGVQKEAYLASTPCVTLRDETEWSETVDAGWNRVAGVRGEAVGEALSDVEFLRRDRPRPELFGDGQAATRVVGALERLVSPSLVASG